MHILFPIQVSALLACSWRQITDPWLSTPERYDVMGPVLDPSFTRAVRPRPIELIIDTKEPPGHWRGRGACKSPPLFPELKWWKFFSLTQPPKSRGGAWHRRGKGSLTGIGCQPPVWRCWFMCSSSPPPLG